MITVCQLIEVLKRFPPHRRVLVSGYEDGFDDVFAESIVSKTVQLVSEESEEVWWSGIFDEVRNESTAKNPLDVVVIPRCNR
jgi:hypothetical protein